MNLSKLFDEFIKLGKRWKLLIGISYYDNVLFLVRIVFGSNIVRGAVAYSLNDALELAMKSILRAKALNDKLENSVKIFRATLDEFYFDREISLEEDKLINI